MKRFVRYIIFLLMVVAVAGCHDELMREEVIGEGRTRVSATLDFRPMFPALSHTRSSGKALEDITSLHVLLYDGNTGELKSSWELAKDKYTVSDEKRTDMDAENGVCAEDSTKRVTFSLPDEIDFGRYYIYAVANIPDLLTKYGGNIETVDGLKSIPLTWNQEDISANGQMIGYFTKDTAIQPEEDPVALNEQSTKLHAWLRRAASKVTVAYDGSGLKEGVFIYLQSVQIKDIPLQCYLGKENKVGAKDYGLEVPGKGTDLPDGEIITYHEGDKIGDGFEYNDACTEHRVTVGAPYFGSHAETAPALYFYENMQGAGEDMPDKRQDASGDGVLDNPGLPDSPTYRLKDNVPYGTYIEVKAHYISINSERLGNGSIIYRFMLGQDVIKNYNAKRNCHYKLTLKFKNFANEADWHIEYVEPEPGVMTPEPYYISYLYNHSMMYPIKVSTGGRTIKKITARITENCWAPNTTDNVFYTPENKGKTEPWNGFLSLHKTTETVLYQDSIGSNQKYYYKSPQRGWREYKEFTLKENVNSAEFKTDSSDLNDKYRIERHPTEENTYNIYIPMYTRAKQMISTTGYTGNNPYVAYQRKARVEIKTYLEGMDKPFVNNVTIYQVRRVVNPKGIYRSMGNNKSFHVVLKRLPGEDERYFKPFQSEGPWKAYIIRRTNGDGITLSATAGKSEERNDPEYGRAIHGKTGSVIDFNVDFSGTSSTANRYAIIRVEYHNYTCQHLIFVRQGDLPDSLVQNGTIWYAQNMRTTTELASNPLDEGSLFKFRRWDLPIDALSNKNPNEEWINVTDESFDVYPKDGFIIAGTEDKMAWEDITSIKSADFKKDSVFGNPEMEGARMATYQDYWELRSHSFIEQGYGILYGDDAEETADYIVDAYGYDYKNNKQGRGMRGCFVYNSNTGKNLFFPIGASGYGHRKQSYVPTWGDTESLNGVLRYAAGRTKLYATPTGRPLFYDLYKRPGAIYWINQEKPKEDAPKTDDNSLGWDINYFTFDFNFIGTGNLIRAGGSDACFVRCVKE